MEKDQQSLNLQSETSQNNDESHTQQELQNVDQGIRNDSPSMMEHSEIQGKFVLYRFVSVEHRLPAETSQNEPLGGSQPNSPDPVDRTIEFNENTLSIDNMDDV